MRTTLRIDSDLMAILKKLARRDDVPLTELVNGLIRRGLQASSTRRRESTDAYHEQVFSMGQPAVNLDKALDLAASLEDEEVIEEIARRK